ELTPSIIVRSKNGLHAYWRLRAGESLDRFESAQVALATALRTDPSVKDLPRVMRVPGFFHRKDAEPFLVKMVQTSDVTYDIPEDREGLGASPQPERPPPRTASPRLPAPLAAPESGSTSRAR